MFKNFCPSALGINGRQSELIELALTYAFRGMDVDMTLSPQPLLNCTHSAKSLSNWVPSVR